MFPLDRWYVAGFSWEFQDKPIARTLLGQPVVLFRGGGEIAALEDRCCHRHLPLSCGVIEGSAIRCGYHGLLYAHDGRCIEIPGQHRSRQWLRARLSLQERNPSLDLDGSNT
jgi:vanillate O-demethylase monooxygenase subunit